MDDFRQIAVNALLFNGAKSQIYGQATDVRNCVLELLKDRSGEMAPFEKVLESWVANALDDDVSESIRDKEAVDAAVEENEMKGAADDTNLNAVSSAAHRSGSSGGAAAAAAAAAAACVRASAGASTSTAAVDQDLLLAWKKTHLKKSNAGMLPCISVHRVSPVDVKSNATGCLFKHLLSGNLLMLGHDGASAAPSSGGGGGGGGSKDSHFLMNHKGEVFMHFMDTAQTLLEAVPHLEKCGGGAVADYRVEALKDLALHNMLMGTPAGIKRMPRNQLIHETRYFPLTRSEGIAIEHPLLSSLFGVLRNLSIDRLSLERCTETALHFFKSMQINSTDYFPELSDRKRPQAYGQVRKELMEMASAYANTSPNHTKFTTTIETLAAGGGQ